ncbi:hypothetical protein LJC60_01325 [Ruminococcaceae bacterium OttesenSCG-928-D13]|nr:hypothetical protein [Ruminococcaceae bacterium OttesenSCG-928-D13]
MGDSFDKIMDTAGKVAGAAVKGTTNLVNKGRDKAEELALQAKLSKLQRQLGSLVYALRKNDEENEPMIAWYITEIDRINAKLASLGTPAEKDPDFKVYGGPTAGAEEDSDAFFRDGGGD